MEQMTDPTLTSAQVTFQTDTDNKGEDSIIEVIVRDVSDSQVARASGSYGKFDNFSTNGPFSLEVLNQVPRSSLKPGGSILLNFTPRNQDDAGNDDHNDNWAFNCYVDLVFSDASHVSVSEDGLKMGPKMTQATMGL
jgi:hypothetical protein